MRLRRFTVSGFKNLRQEVTLDELGAINVIHGENNVGKSNLLQAIDLFFHVLRELPQRWPFGTPRDDFAQDNWAALIDLLGYSPGEIFNLEGPAPIEMMGTFQASVRDIPDATLLGTGDGHEIEIGLRIERDVKLRFRVPAVTVRSAGETIREAVSSSEGRYRQLIDLVALMPFSEQQRSRSRYMLIGTDRRTRDERNPAAGEPSAPADRNFDCLVPNPLLLALYDAKESLEPEQYRPWELFVDAMREFEDIIGKGELVALFHRRKNRANLALQTDKARIPINLQGSGVQQIVALVAHLLTSNATFVAIEEPELNLRYDLQGRLREVLDKIVASPAGPSQIFLTSHSPAFESGDCFYAMRATDSGPVVERRRIEEAPLFTTHTLQGLPPDSSAPLSYVTSEGLVQLPEAIRKELGVEHGGGVVIMKRKDAPYIELLTDQEFFELMRGPGDAEPRDDQG